MYCLLLPLALVTDMGWFTATYARWIDGLVGVHVSAFGQDWAGSENRLENTIIDVPLTRYDDIEVNLRQLLGRTVCRRP